VVLLIIKNKAKAVLLMLFSSFSFACMGAFVKLAGNLPTFEKAFSRNFISLIFSIFIIYKDRENPMGKPETENIYFTEDFWVL
jgi:drug/metabolite transporter (DMT)-like permease